MTAWKDKHTLKERRMQIREALWAVFNKNTNSVVRLCETRDIARRFKKNYGGLECNITIIKYVPSSEVR